MKTCPYCQKSIADDSVYCENCGKQIGKVEKNKSKIAACLWAVIVLLVLACGAFGFLYYAYYAPLEELARCRYDDVKIHNAYIHDGCLYMKTSSFYNCNLDCKINVYNEEGLVQSIPMYIYVPQGIISQEYCNCSSFSPGTYTKLEIWKDDECLYTLNDVFRIY